MNAKLVLFHVLFWSIHIALFIFGYFKQKNDASLALLNTIGQSVLISRGAGLVMILDCSVILLCVCRNLVRVMRGVVGNFIPVDLNLYLHRWTAYSLIFFALIHTNAHYYNFFTAEDDLNLFRALKMRAWQLHYMTWAGTTGHIMLFLCFLMYTSARLEVKKNNFEMFWYTHHLFFPFFICLFFHAFGCFVKSVNADGSTTCKGYGSNYYTVPVFCLYMCERLLRIYRSRQPTSLSKVIFHPGNTMELRLEKPTFHYVPGQYLFMCIPDISKHQWHPFTISSCPEEGFISVHIKINGDWTKAAASLLNRYVDSKTITLASHPPKVLIDGPYGAPAEDLKKYKYALLIGAGIGVTPAASLLKSIWYEYSRSAPIPLKKLFFYWVTREKESIAWFQSLLASIEESIPKRKLEIHTYISAPQTLDSIHQITLNSGAEVDPVTQLSNACHYGRPNWVLIFQNIRGGLTYNDVDGMLEIGVFFCGPGPMAKVVGDACVASSDDQVKFVLRKEHF